MIILTDCVSSKLDGAFYHVVMIWAGTRMNIAEMMI